MIKKILCLALLLAAITACEKQGSLEGKKNTAQPKTAEQAEDWRAPYPAHWWEFVDPVKSKGWEILPQEAGYKEVILSKRNELGILSNFANTSFVFKGECFRTLESYWQMMKYPENEADPRSQWTDSWIYTREQVKNLTGSQAKSAGNYANRLMEKNNANWVTFQGERLTFSQSTPGRHYELIWLAFFEKLRQNPKVQQILLQTGDLSLRPDHGISDRAPREWNYHLLWMDVRELLKQGQIDLNSQEDPNLIQQCHQKWMKTSKI